ncbi:hypothetical protein OEA41_001959 [Lepraria neglecta]|uniref:Peptidase A1 domain-containing protein n=1 Tax=Lepraria neglecta TaxID=209136 RepID=A0AAD9ZBM7_9LECA|nr:hypothetical protein OEA41_001959 [Lepraria neglecta]
MNMRDWLHPRATNNSQIQPFSFPPSQTWDGNAGSWSTFIIQVGAPPQIFRILPATNGDETWVPIAAGCNQTGGPSDCGNLRGANAFQVALSQGFNKNSPSTWVDNGAYNLLMEDNLDLDNNSANGDYGFDTVELGNSPGGLSLEHQVVAGVATNTFWLGVFGLGPKPANFTAPVPSSMKNLADQSLIPSLLFGYTAGVKYRGVGCLGSLTLGGYDKARHIANNVSFDFDSNDSRSLTVSLQSITATRTLNGDVEPLQTGIFSLIDSGVPEIWLPTAACEAFAVTFTIGPQATGGPSIAFKLPYASFDLQASFPIYPNATNYFPIRRANSTQYTIGRTFLHEAYVTVDYERSKFHISQAAFPDSNSEDLVAIYPPSATDTSSFQSGGSKLGPAEVAGITLGAVAISLFICGFAYFCFRRRRRRLPTKGQSGISVLGWKSELPANDEKIPTESEAARGKDPISGTRKIDLVSPLPPDEKVELESPATGIAKELPSLPSIRHELEGSQAANELHYERNPVCELPTDDNRSAVSTRALRTLFQTSWLHSGPSPRAPRKSTLQTSWLHFGLD